MLWKREFFSTSQRHIYKKKASFWKRGEWGLSFLLPFFFSFFSFVVSFVSWDHQKMGDSSVFLIGVLTLLPAGRSVRLYRC